MKYTRVHRLLRIVSLLQSGQPQRAPDLAAACGTAERTIFRDLREIERAGIPIAFDRKAKRYRIDGEFFMSPVQLTLDEALAMAALVEDVGKQGQVPFLAPASRAMAKIAAQLPGSVRKEVWSRAHHLSIRTAPAMPADGCADVFNRIQAAMAEGRVLKCRYEAASGEDRSGRKVFHFRPYALFFAVRAWYAVGERSDRDGLRSLKLSRFAAIELTDLRYEIPSDFSLEKHLGNAWRMIRGDVDYDVLLHVDEHFAPTVCDTLWHRTMETEEQPDGSCLVRFRVSGLDEIEWWILSMGPHCRVIKPAELATRVRQLAAQTARQYDAIDETITPPARRGGRGGRRTEPAAPRLPEPKQRGRTAAGARLRARR